MRSAPVLLLLLLVAAGLGLGARVLLRGSAGGAPGAGPTTHAPPWPTAIAGVPQGHVYTGVCEEPEDVNPFTTSGAAARRFVLAMTHDTLLDCDPRTGALRGALAAAFEPSEDGRSCVFTLRDGVRFADGSPLTMADVLFAWELARGGLEMGSIGDAFRRVESVEVLDDRRFRVAFRDGHHAVVQAVGESWIVGCRAFFVERVRAAAEAANEPAPAVGTPEFAVLLGRIDHECGPGTGPYVLENLPGGPSTWRRRQDLQLVRNDHCWRRDVAPGSWNFAGIRLLFRDPGGAVTALLRHEVDWYAATDVDALVASHPALLQEYERLQYDHRTLGVFNIVWNCGRTPLDLPAVRRALAMLFDVDAILETFGGAGVPALAFAKPDSPDYPRDVERIPFDPAAARRALREAGFDPDAGTPLRLRVLAPHGLEAMRRTLDLFADAAKRAGVLVQIRIPEWSTFVREKDAGEWDGLFVQQMFRPWADPFEFVHSDALYNHGSWSSPEADRLATQAREERDPARRTGLLHELHTLVYREQPVAFLLHPRVVVLRNRNVENSAPGPLGLVLDRAFVEPEFQRR